MEFSLDGGANWARAAGTFIPREAIGNSATAVIVRTAATATAAFSEERTVLVPDGSGNAPIGLAIDFTREVVTGVAPGMQHSVNGTTWTNITGNELNIATLIPAANAASNVTLRIRVAATATTPASDAQILILTRRPATPVASTARFDGFTASLILADTMEYRAGTAAAIPWTSVPSGQSSVSVSLGTAAVTHQVRIRATASSFASAAFNITVPRRLAAPNAVYNIATDRITGVTTAMEFSLDGGTTWARVAGTFIPRESIGSSATAVIVRTAATATAAVSEERIVNVPEGPSNAPTGLTIDFAREVVTGVAPGMQHSTNGTTWTNITGTELNIAAMIPAAGTASNVTLRIRFAATATVPASDAQILILPRRPAAPLATAARFDGFTESLILADTMEYRAGTAAAIPWTPVPSGQSSVSVSLGTAAVTHQVRIRATASSFASAALNVSVPRRPVAPNAVYNAATDRITGVTTAMEFSLDGGATWTRVTGTFIPRDVFGNDGITVVRIRTAATATAAVSEERLLRVPAI